MARYRRSSRTRSMYRPCRAARKLPLPRPPGFQRGLGVAARGGVLATRRSLRPAPSARLGRERCGNASGGDRRLDALDYRADIRVDRGPSDTPFRTHLQLARRSEDRYPSRWYKTFAAVHNRTAVNTRTRGTHADGAGDVSETWLGSSSRLGSHARREVGTAQRSAARARSSTSVAGTICRVSRRRRQARSA